jgi:hypothetical protein
MFELPKNGTVILEHEGVNYLVSRLEGGKTSAEFVAELQQGKPVVVPFSRRGHITGLLKKAGIFTRQQTLVAGQWITFLPCAKRDFKP